MTETKALIATFVGMVILVVAASFGLGLLDANDEVVFAVLFFIACGAGLAVSAVVGHYAKRDADDRRQSHNPPPSG